MSIEETDALLLNTRSFLSFQITQTEVNQIILKNICVDLGNPAMLVNWIKYWWRSLDDAEEIPNQSQMWDQRDPNTLQSIKRCVAVSLLPHPDTHTASEWTRTLCRTKLSLVGSRLRRRRHTNTDTLEGKSLCQTSKTWDLSAKSPEVVRKRYTPRTEYPWMGSKHHLQVSSTESCKTMFKSNKEHSRTLSSSHANNRLRHTLSLPSTAPNILLIFSTEHSLWTDKSKMRGNLNFKGTSPTQISC